MGQLYCLTFVVGLLAENLRLPQCAALESDWCLCKRIWPWVYV